MNIQILSLADRKRFLLFHCQTMDLQSYFIVLKHVFLLGFPRTINKPWIFIWHFVERLETTKKIVYLIGVTENRKKMWNLFSSDCLTMHYSMVGGNVEQRLVLPLQEGKKMDFDSYKEYLTSTSKTLKYYQGSVKKRKFSFSWIYRLIRKQ